MSTAVKRACDACHRRKVKCDGINPCRNCSSAQLSCTYNAIPQKKGPKGSRAKVISELRENQRQSSLSMKIQNHMNGMGNPSMPTLAPTPGLLTNEMVKACIDFFFAHMYPTMPILDRQRIEQDAMSMDTTLDTYCLLCSLCAFMMLQPGMFIPTSDPYGPENMPGASIITATRLLEETIRVRKGYDYLHNPTFYTIATNYFLFACHYGLDLQEKAWCDLREATTLVHLARMNKEETYQTWDKIDATRRRRLFWLLYAAERAYALQNDRPLSLKATVNPPIPVDDPSDPCASQLIGFCRLVSLFRPFDGAFVDLWNKTRSDCNSAIIATLQKQQNDVLGALAGADPQASEVLRNQQWLKNLAWQINLARGSAASGNDMATYQYTVADVSREMVSMAASFSSHGSSELLNSGIIEALFTITSELTEVLSMMPSSGNPFTVSPQDNLHQITNILALLRIGEHRFAPLLLVKLHEILPRLVNPMLLSSPDTTGEIDLFDGFGTAGMVPQPYLGMDEFKVEAASSTGGAPSMHDVNSPFVSSPPILSPGMDFSHSMNGDFAPMSDIIHQRVPGSISSLSSSSGNPTNGQRQLQPQLIAQVPAHQSSQQQRHSLETQHPSQNPQQPHPSQQQLLQHIPQQQFQQPQVQQQHTHTSVSMLQSLGQNISSNCPTRSHARDSFVSASSTSIGGQPTDQSTGMAGGLNNQPFAARSEDDINNSLGMNNIALGPQSQRTGFEFSSQQIRTVGDFHALQRANSDINSLSPLAMNSLRTDLEFSSLR